jgi:hypothetical protein
MSWINEIIQQNASRIFEYPTIQEFCYLRIFDENQLQSKNISNLQGEEEVLAAKGFRGTTPNSEELSIINKPINKRIVHYKHDKYKLIGICLASDKNSQAYKYIQDFVNKATSKETFLVQKFFPEFKKSFLEKLKSENTNDTATKILKHIYQNEYESEIEIFITELSRKELETFDLIILAELQSHFSKKVVKKTIYQNLSAKDLIIEILENFENAVIKITDPKERYGGKSSNPKKQPKTVIKIEDEYDVQDLLYVSLKSVFPTMKYENPLAKFGGKSTRLDFVLMEEGVIIEVKQINASEKNDSKFTDQLKIDIESYHLLDYLKDLIFYIYAPNAIQDSDNFYELQGERQIKGKTFNVKIIMVR